MLKAPGFFITATDTGAGKTWVTCMLLRALRVMGVDAVGFKPICCGSREDGEALWTASGEVEPLDRINPIWFRTPTAPYSASLIENRMIDTAFVRSTFAALQMAHRAVLVEGIGGWRVPIAKDYAVSDLAADLALPVLLVVANRLGALNHAVLTAESIAVRGLPLAGIILNHADAGSAEEVPARTTNPAVLEDLLGVPVACEIGLGQNRLESAQLRKIMGQQL